MTQDWNKSPKGKFNRQKNNAKRRGIEWLLTFEEWWKIWEDSGKWLQRGLGRDVYCMSRRKDTGPYSVENVFIQSGTNNRKDSKKYKKPFLNYTFSPVQRKHLPPEVQKWFFEGLDKSSLPSL